MIKPTSHHNTTSAFKQLQSSMITPQKTPEIQVLNLSLKQKSSVNSGSKQKVKLKPFTDRIHPMNENLKDFMEGMEQCSQVMEWHNSQKTDLLQKRKQYAQSIRQKNRCSMKQQKSNKRSYHKNQTLNQSLIFTPPKDSLICNSDSHCRVNNCKKKHDHISEIEKQYYSIKKVSNMEHSNSNVFAQSNMNLCNSVILGDSNNQEGHLSKEGNCSKLKSANQNTSIELEISHRDHKHSQRKTTTNNKQNKPYIPSHPPSARKNTQQKYTSYAEIFDKKSSMNALIHSQKCKGNGGSRQMGTVRKERSALRAMATSEQKLELSCEGFSVELDKFVNGFGLEGFNEEIVGISGVNVCENEEKMVEVSKNKTKTLQSQTLQTITINQPSLPGNFPRSLIITSKIINQQVDFSQEYQKIRKQQQKQLVVLAKQNTTFKRELASFRKDNSTLTKELQKKKQYIEELEQKANRLIEQNSNQIIVSEGKAIQKGMETLQVNINLSHQSKIIPPSTTSHLQTPDPTLQQILISTQQQLFSLKSDNKTLELKVYMLEKKLAHQQELSKKRLALEVHSWRDKYNKLRNQNIRLKNQMHPFNNNDLSFSMDISREE